MDANTQVIADFSIQGDVDSDGAVDLADAILALQTIVRMSPAQAVNKGADVDGDGKIGLAEVIYILQKAAAIR
jgi:Ca2+-binding EF-hand superfamily protein